MYFHLVILDMIRLIQPTLRLKSTTVNFNSSNLNFLHAVLSAHTEHMDTFTAQTRILCNLFCMEELWGTVTSQPVCNQCVTLNVPMNVLKWYWNVIHSHYSVNQWSYWCRTAVSVTALTKVVIKAAVNCFFLFIYVRDTKNQVPILFPLQ